MCKSLIFFILCGLVSNLYAQTISGSKSITSEVDTPKIQPIKYISSVNIGLLNNNNLDKIGGLSNFSFTLVGAVSRVKYYLRLKFNVTQVKGEYQSNNSNLTNYNESGYYNFNGRIKSNRSGYTGGVIFGGEILSVYLGVGYGSRDLLWGINKFSYQNTNPDSQSWARNVPNSFSGPEVETGILIRKGLLNIMAGINSIEFKYIDAYVGIGLNIIK